MEPVKDFKQLRVWKQAMELVGEVYGHTRLFPKEELYGLSNQLRRAAVSIPSNIAEGFKRYHLAEKRQFMNIAAGSAGELETQLILACQLGFIPDHVVGELLEKLNHVSRMISSLINRIEDKTK